MRAFRLATKTLFLAAALSATGALADTAPPAPAAPKVDPTAEALKPCAEEKDPAVRAVACTQLITGGSLNGKALAAAYLFRGEAQAARKEYDAAVEDFSKAVKTDSEASAPLYDRAQVYALIGRGELALLDFNSLLQLVPNDPDTLAARAELYVAAGKNAEALDDLSGVLAQRPDDFETRLEHAGVSIQAGHYEDAIADCGELLKANPKSPAAFYNRGRAEYLKGEYKSAALDFTQAMQNRENNPYAALRLYLANANLSQADASPLKLSTSKFPADQWPMPIVAFYLGNLSADDLLAETRVTDPAVAANLGSEAHYYIGQLALVKQDKKAAKQHFKAAIASKADRANLEFIDAGLALQKLGS